VAQEQPYFSNRAPAERCYIEHVRISLDDDGEYALLREAITQKLERGWRLDSMIKLPSGDSLRLEWDTSEAHSEN
jgi:hypothetical protein